MRWSGEKRNIFERWGAVPAIAEAAIIQGFLRSRQEVSDALNRLDLETKNLTTTAAMAKFFSSVEKRHGFNSSVVTVNKILTTESFLAYPLAKRPIYDLGAPQNRHGHHTHRLQWVLYCYFIEENQHVFSSNIKNVAGVYQIFGHRLSWISNTDTNNLWNDVLDRSETVDETACSPEFLHKTFLASSYPRIHGLLNEKL